MLESAMPRTITITDQTFAELQGYGEPFVDTPEDAIRKLLALAKGQKKGEPPAPPGPTADKDFNPKAPPDLTHTRVLSVDFLGAPLPKSEATWNGLLIRVIIAAHGKLPSFADLKKIIHVNMVAGKKQDEG